MKSTIAALATAVLALTSCATEGAVSEDRRGSNAPAAGKKKAPADDGTVAFGKTYAWDSGLSVKVSKPKPFKPSEFAFGGKAPHNVRFTVTLVNGTNKPYDPVTFLTTMQSGNKEATEVFDEGLDGAPMTKVLPGREVSFPVGYNVANPKDLVLEVSPDLSISSVLFAS